MHIRTRLLLAAVLAAAATPVFAESFDGKWIADIPAQGRCNFTGAMTLVVSGDDIVGQVRNSAGVNPAVAHFKGRLGANGEATFTVDNRFEGTMKFESGRFDATWNNGNCNRHAEGDRAPTPEQEKALLDERKQHQAEYAALVARAQAGDKTLDYGKLRAASVYAETWEFYGNRVAGLLDEARVSVKGKDCVAGLSKVDQAIGLDFVVDEAHALKADCLRQTGHADQARLEQAIADALTHSLMDSAAGQHSLIRTLTGGDGARVDSAYVVTTYREEMEILAKKDIVLKARQTVVRGSDGRFYDRITGIYLRNGVHVVDIGPQNVYFDVTNFVVGKASRRAADDVAVASIQ